MGWTLQRNNPIGPDDVPGQVLKHSAGKLTVVLTDLFNIFLQQASVPIYLKPTRIIPEPKETAIKSLIDYQPVALTLVVMKCFE